MTEETRSVHTERYYEKSNKSNTSNKSNSSNPENYIRANSNVSNSENLICDNCLNDRMMRRK